MIAKKNCTATSCQLCKRQCDAGSTDSGFIENNGACLRCCFGKSKGEIQALVLAKAEGNNQGLSVVDDTFNDDLLILTFGELGMSEGIKAVEVISAKFDGKGVRVLLGSDGITYFQRSHIGRLLNLRSGTFIYRLDQIVGGAGIGLALNDDLPTEFLRKFLTKQQVVDYLLARLKNYKNKRKEDADVLEWLNKTEFFNPKCPTLAYKVAHIPYNRYKNEIAVDMGSKQDKTVTTLACLACDSKFPIDSAQAMAMGQGDGCPTCQIELIAENCEPSRLVKIIQEKPHLYFDKAYADAKPNTDKMRLIGIAGQARSGKDTLASYLLNNLSNDWTRSSFADPIKNMLNVIGVDCSDDAKAVIDECFGVTPRHMMQTLGTEWGRNLIDNDIWVKAFARLNAGMCVIVPDVRFENEAELIRQHGVLIHLTGRGGIAGNHVSENPVGFKEGDIVIDNSRDLAWLYAQVDNNAVLSNFVGVE